jgi:geranylgeranyl diphosphate synthase type I
MNHQQNSNHILLHGMRQTHATDRHTLTAAIKNRIEKSLKQFIRQVDRQYSLSKLSPVLFNNIQDFVLRDGKRIRPLLFVIGYLGFSKKAAPHLYTCALSFELLHDFTLIHDDIIDKSETRRGKPSVHTMLNHYLLRFKKIKFNGQDLAIVIGDILYAIAIHAFLSIKEDMQRKEQALKKFIETTIYTGAGEFNELLYAAENIETITIDDIYKIYDFKTAYYSFASPLIIGAELAGAPKKQLSKLSRYGMYLGRAFQIKDDILGMFASEKAIGKSVLSDLQEAKKTILVWYAYRNSTDKVRKTIQKILSKEHISYSDLRTMKHIIIASKALDFAKNEIDSLIYKTQRVTDSLSIKDRYRDLLNLYALKLLQV